MGVIFMKLIDVQFIADPKNYQYDTHKTSGKTNDIDKKGTLVFFDVPEK